MFNLLLLSEDAQVAIFLLLAEDAIKYFINKEFTKSAKNALNSCWDYIEKRSVNGDDLYELIDSNEYDITDLQADAETENDVRVWDCVIDSVLYTCRKAYDVSNEHLPQAVEIADFTLYEHFISQYILLDSNNNEMLRRVESFFSSNYNKTGVYKKFNISDLKRLIQN